MIYTTVQGDCWDVIAMNIYGDVRQTPALIRANPAYRDVTVFSGGIGLFAPELDVTAGDDELPPWKQVSG